MSGSAIFRAEFAGEDRTFRLPLGRLRAVQEKVDAGPMELLQRYAGGNWRIDDVREVILQGLIGGGMDAPRAGQLIKTGFDDLPVLPFVPLAQGVVMAALCGSEDEDLGESPGEVSPKSPSPEERSGSEASTASPPPSVTIRAKPTT
ncbi:MAG: gene transfer agent family protein [Brevundimonas diminuta]|nr:gene transfer agent family protein [Brevundimonas diminuta]MBD3818404.1 gene transfer agent family protein [Brevundimonas diminuta]